MSMSKKLAEAGASVRRRLSSGPPVESSGSQSDGEGTSTSSRQRRKATQQYTDVSMFSSSEFNDDPQWKLVFLDNYDKLCKQVDGAVDDGKKVRPPKNWKTCVLSLSLHTHDARRIDNERALVAGDACSWFMVSMNTKRRVK